MKIAVAVKEVLDARVPVAVAAAGAELRQGPGAPIRTTNPADRAALEVALLMRSRIPRCRVEAFSVCGAAFAGALHHALARGVDHAERIEPRAAAPTPVATALALFRRLEAGRFDLVACGDETLDNASALVGPCLAELLGWAQVTSICGVRELTAEKGIFVRKLERGAREVVEACLPLVATFTAEAERPRYVSERLLERARRRAIPVFAPADRIVSSGVPAWPEGERRIAPRARIKKRFAPDANLSAADRVKMIMAGGAAQPASAAASILEGEPEYLVEQLYRFLKHHEFV
jgi:electron transfer flavoprotein beta subunit